MVVAVGGGGEGGHGSWSGPRAAWPRARPVDEVAIEARRVRFEHYESPKTDAKGIHRSPEVHPVAWFRDPAGNVLSVVQA